ncbi:hypothetical protein ACWFR1_11645 [Streptomyces sp. NPDC055103]
MKKREHSTWGAIAVLLLVMTGCQAVNGDDGDDGCGWFALAAEAKPAPPAPRPAAPAPAAKVPAPVRKAPSLEKQPTAPKDPAPRRTVPVPPAAQAPTVRKSPTPTTTSTKKPGHRRGGHGSDLCDD